jgi:hypothetical protein
MKTIGFMSCISHTYDTRASNPCISNTYEKNRGWGSPLTKIKKKCPKEENKNAPRN